MPGSLTITNTISIHLEYFDAVGSDKEVKRVVRPQIFRPSLKKSKLVFYESIKVEGEHIKDR